MPHTPAPAARSPDTPGMVEWTQRGARLVWVLNPKRRQIRVHRTNGTTSALSGDDRLDGEDLLPGFSVPVNELFT